MISQIESERKRIEDDEDLYENQPLSKQKSWVSHIDLIEHNEFVKSVVTFKEWKSSMNSTNWRSFMSLHKQLQPNKSSFIFDNRIEPTFNEPNPKMDSNFSWIFKLNENRLSLYKT